MVKDNPEVILILSLVGLIILGIVGMVFSQSWGWIPVLIGAIGIIGVVISKVLKER